MRPVRVEPPPPSFPRLSETPPLLLQEELEVYLPPESPITTHTADRGSHRGPKCLRRVYCELQVFLLQTNVNVDFGSGGVWLEEEPIEYTRECVTLFQKQKQTDGVADFLCQVASKWLALIA